ncbi:MAG: hypothetical protein ACOX5M_01440 [Bacillota bacterium]|jgi:hypothetical protein
MSNTSLADEIRWLPFRDTSHRSTLLCLMARARIGTADDAFVPLYLLAATGPHSECYVGPSGIDFDGLAKASVRMGSAVTALLQLAEALSKPDSPFDITQVLSALEGTPEHSIAVQALRMKWEI